MCWQDDITCKAGSSGSSSSLLGCQGRSQLSPLLSSKTSSSSLLAEPLLQVGSPPLPQTRSKDTEAHAAQPQHGVLERVQRREGEGHRAHLAARESALLS